MWTHIPVPAFLFVWQAAKPRTAKFILNLHGCHNLNVYLDYSVVGLILFYLWNDRTILYGMISAGFFFMVLFYPRLDEWRSRLKELRDEDQDLASLLKKQSIGRG